MPAAPPEHVAFEAAVLRAALQSALAGASAGQVVAALGLPRTAKGRVRNALAVLERRGSLCSTFAGGCAGRVYRDARLPWDCAGLSAQST